MKVNQVKKVEAKFEPISITIDFESKEEIEEFYALFSITSVCDALNYVDHEKIRETISLLGYTNDNVYKLYDKIKELCNKLDRKL